MRRPSGWYAANDFGSMRMMTVGCSLGLNMTYFLVCLQTVPALCPFECQQLHPKPKILRFRRRDSFSRENSYYLLTPI
jgi:hypothetical protein